MFEVSGQSDAGGLAPGEFDMLTDALRAGPGTPEWGRAVQQFKNGQSAEFRALLKARQRLEAGKAYRALDSSPHLTEAVLACIAAEALPRPRRVAQLFSHFAISSKSAVALFSVAATLLVVVGGLYFESRYLQNDTGERSPINFPNMHRGGLLTSTAGFSSFDGVIPASWKPIGSLRVEARHGLRLAGGVKQIDQSGGIVWADPISPAKPFKIQARVRYQGSAAVSPEIFLTDDGTFDDNRPADQNHEFAWTVLNDRPQVRLADRTLAAAGDSILAGQSFTLAVDIKFDGPTATVETNMGGHCSHWTGLSQLASGKPLYMGMRLVVHGAHKDDCVAVETVRLATAK